MNKIKKHTKEKTEEDYIRESTEQWTAINIGLDSWEDVLKALPDIETVGLNTEYSVWYDEAKLCAKMLHKHNLPINTENMEKAFSRKL